jgi:hypothetical protein
MVLRLTFALAVLAAGAALGVQTASAAGNPCTSTATKRSVRSFGPVQQTLVAGQYRAFRTRSGWTICDAKAGPQRRLRSFTFDFDGPRTVGVKLLARPGRCLGVQLRPVGRGVPKVATIDMRNAKNARAGATINEVDRDAPGATIVKAVLSSTCLLGIASRSADGSRGIYLAPVIPPNVLIDRFKLGAQATDADLRAFALDGDEVRWSDAGERRSKRYAGRLP